MRFSHFLRTQIFDAILLQHASTFAPKAHQNRFKNWSWKASIFWSIFASIFKWFWLDFGSPIGAMLATFSVKMGVRCAVFLSFCLGRCSYSSFEPSWPPLAKNVTCRPSILKGCGLDFRMFWAPFWKFLVTICPLFGVHCLHNLRIDLINFLK